MPDDGVTVTPAGSAATCQSTVTAWPSAEAAPSWSVVACPAVRARAPLGTEEPTAGTWPAVYEGGASAGSFPHAGSGLAERVKSSVAPVLITDAGSQGKVHWPAGAESFAADAQVAAAVVGLVTPCTVKARM